MDINPNDDLDTKREYMRKQEIIDRLDEWNFQLASERMWREFELLGFES